MPRISRLPCTEGRRLSRSALPHTPFARLCWRHVRHPHQVHPASHGAHRRRDRRRDSARRDRPAHYTGTGGTPRQADRRSLPRPGPWTCVRCPSWTVPGWGSCAGLGTGSQHGTADSAWSPTAPVSGGSSDMSIWQESSKCSRACPRAWPKRRPRTPTKPRRADRTRSVEDPLVPSEGQGEQRPALLLCLTVRPCHSAPPTIRLMLDRLDHGEGVRPGEWGACTNKPASPTEAAAEVRLALPRGRLWQPSSFTSSLRSPRQLVSSWPIRAAHVSIRSKSRKSPPSSDRSRESPRPSRRRQSSGR